MHEHSRTRRRSRSSPAAGRRAAWTVTALALLLLAGCSGEAPLPGDPLRLVTIAPPEPVLGEPYAHDLTPAGGLRPYAFTLEEGTLPPGLALQGGTLIGTPTELGRYEFTISVSDANLSTTYEDYALTVRDVPVPTLDLAVPETEVRGDTTLRARVVDARRLRGVRVWIDWEDPSLGLGEAGIRASRDDVAVFRSERDGGVAIDAVVLGEPLTGDAELFRLDLTTDEALILGLDVRTEFLYAGRHAFDEERLGAPPASEEEPAEAVEPPFEPTPVKGDDPAADEDGEDGADPEGESDAAPEEAP